jgi:hypothetical protein
MSDFWARQKAKQQPPQAPVSNSEPWWARGTELLTTRETVPQTPAQSHTEAVEQASGKIDGHDVSRAELLKGRAQECPRCPVNPRTGVRGNMNKPSASSPFRCFDCGYIEDNRFRGETDGMAAVSEGPPQRARQTVSGGGAGSNYMGESGNSADVVGRLN